LPDVSAQRWSGSGYLPGRWGLWGVQGLAVVEMAGARVTVRVRPGVLGRLMGVVPLVAEPGSGLKVTTRRVRLGWGWFIDFQLPGESRVSTTGISATTPPFLAAPTPSPYPPGPGRQRGRARRTTDRYGQVPDAARGAHWGVENQQEPVTREMDEMAGLVLR
jgi:hypothetical protein